MQNSRFRTITILLIAITLQLIPSFTPMAFWRPDFVLLVLIYLILYQPYLYGITSAWLTGLVMDFITGGVIGQYALTLGICSYVLHLLRRRFLHARIWHQCLLVFFLVLLAQLIVSTVNMLTGRQLSWDFFLFPAISSMMLWPLFYLLMRRQAR